MATLFDENRFETEIDAKVKTIVKNELPKESVHRATVLRQDSTGIWWVRLDSGEETPVLVNKVDMSVGDVVTVTLRDHVTYADGNITSPPMSASNTQQYVGDVVAHSVKAVAADIGFLKADVATIGYAQIEDADITNARIQNLVYEVRQNITHLNAVDANILELQTNSLTANSAVITNLQAETAKIEDLTAEQLEATVGYIEDLTAGSIQAADIIADHAEVSNLDANYAHITDGVIDNAKIDYADVEDLDANYAHITDGVIDNASIGYADVEDLDAHYAHITNGVIDTAKIGYANVNGLSTNYAQINLANVNNAWIENGVVKDAAITDAQILGVSANKLTAGTIDASNINVSNLRADTLIVNRINGQPVIGGYVAVDSSANGYSSMNPSTQGWYEIVNGSMVLSQDVAVDTSKAYYTTSQSVFLYDQSYIDSMESQLNQRIDGAIETFSGSVDPTLVNYPYTDWYDTTTSPVTDNRAEHVGDLYYVVNPGGQSDGYCYRFYYDNTSQQYSWVLIQDSDVTAALGRISDLESFESTTTSWINDTDEGLETIRQNHTTLSGVVAVTIKATRQLWYTKANATAPTKPTDDASTGISNNSPTGSNSYDRWNLAVPVYNSSYPYYFYCWEYELSNGKFRYSAVVYDQATSESEERARTGVANAATAQSTADANIKKSIQLWKTVASSTSTVTKPFNDNSSEGTGVPVTTTTTNANTWTVSVPTYSASHPKYYYCYQQQKGDGTWSCTDPVYDQATSEAMAKAQAALPASTFTNFEQVTFKKVQDTVGGQSTTINQLTTIVDNNGLTSSTNISNTVSTVSQNVTDASTKISQLTTTLGTNADGTSIAGDIVHRVASTETGLNDITTRVGKTEAHLSGQYAVSSTADDANAKTATIVPAVSNWVLETGHTVTVKFEYGNDAEEATAPTLNVNGTGAKAIKNYEGNDLTAAAKNWKAGTALTFTYDGTYWRLQDSSMTERVTQAETIIQQTADNVLIKASRTGATDAEKEAGGNAVIQSLINVAPEGVKIDADKVNITGTAVFNAINNDTGQTKIDGGKIDATSITIGASTLPEAVLRYDITYSYDEDPTTHKKVSATFTAHLYQGATDIKTSYPESCFTWLLKSENWVQGEPMSPLTSNGDYTCTVLLDDVGYGAVVVGRFEPPNDAIALDDDDNALVGDDDAPISVRVPSGDYVRIADLEVAATVFNADKMLVVTSEGEKLATVSTLKAVFGTSSYNDLTNRPQIEGVTLTGDKSFSDLGIFMTDSQGYSVPDEYTLTTMEINALWANAAPIGA